MSRDDDSTPKLAALSRSLHHKGIGMKPKQLSIKPGVTRSPLSAVENSPRLAWQRSNKLPHGRELGEVSGRFVDKENVLHWVLLIVAHLRVREQKSPSLLYPMPTLPQHTLSSLVLKYAQIILKVWPARPGFPRLVWAHAPLPHPQRVPSHYVLFTEWPIKLGDALHNWKLQPAK